MTLYGVESVNHVDGVIALNKKLKWSLGHISSGWASVNGYLLIGEEKASYRPCGATILNNLGL